METRTFTTEEILASWNKSCSVNDDVEREAKDTIKRALELLIAQEQGFVVELPCKIKDTVFVIPTKENGLKEITEMQCLGYAIAASGNVINLFSKNRSNKNVPKMYQPSLNSFGAVWFLTYEDARTYRDKHLLKRRLE